MLATWLPLEHCVKGGHLVDPHLRHLEASGHLSHCRQGDPAVELLLGNVQEGDDRRLHILRRVPLDDRGQLFLGLWAEDKVAPVLTTPVLCG